MDQLRKCSQCGADNRIPARHLAHAGKCGKCKAELPPTSEPIDVDASDFDRIVNESTVPVLVDFWAEWCAPCKMAAPEVKHVANDLAGRALVLKVDTERAPQIAERYNVRGIPNFAVFRGGKLVFQQAGLVNRDVMRKWLKRAA